MFSLIISELSLFLIWRCDSNTQLHDLRIIICLRKSEVIVERISVCNVIENLMEHGKHCLPCACKFSRSSNFRGISRSV